MKKRSSASSMFEEAQKRFLGVQPPEKVHRQGRAHLEALLKRRFMQSLDQRKKAKDSLEVIRAPLIELVKGNKNLRAQSEKSFDGTAS